MRKQDGGENLWQFGESSWGPTSQALHEGNLAKRKKGCLTYPGIDVGGIIGVAVRAQKEGDGGT